MSSERSTPATPARCRRLDLEVTPDDPAWYGQLRAALAALAGEEKTGIAARYAAARYASWPPARNAAGLWTG